MGGLHAMKRSWSGNETLAEDVGVMPIKKEASQSLPAFRSPAPTMADVKNTIMKNKEPDSFDEEFEPLNFDVVLTPEHKTNGESLY
jgi:hypothetical protein